MCHKATRNGEAKCCIRLESKTFLPLSTKLTIASLARHLNLADLSRLHSPSTTVAVLVHALYQIPKCEVSDQAQGQASVHNSQCSALHSPLDCTNIGHTELSRQCTWFNFMKMYSSRASCQVLYFCVLHLRLGMLPKFIIILTKHFST